MKRKMFQKWEQANKKNFSFKNDPKKSLRNYSKQKERNLRKKALDSKTRLAKLSAVTALAEGWAAWRQGICRKCKAATCFKRLGRAWLVDLQRSQYHFYCIHSLLMASLFVCPCFLFAVWSLPPMRQHGVKRLCTSLLQRPWIAPVTKCSC